MNLDRIRKQLLVVFGVLAAVAITIVAFIGAGMGQDRIDERIAGDAERRMVDVSFSDIWADDFDIENVFMVNPETGWTEAMGPMTVEPPLLSVAEQTRAADESFWPFEQDGSWLAYGRNWDDTSVVVIANNIDDAQADLSRLRWLIAVASVTVLGFALGAVWWLSGRLLQPARIAMDQQRDFIADAAHELRTPLAVIQASASQALSRERQPDAYKTSLHEIHQAADRAGAGVGELLELARIQAGQGAPRIAPLRLDLLVEEVGATTMAEGTQVTGEAGDPIVVHADYNLLRQAVANVASNAATRANEVSIRSYLENGWAAVEVSDNGPGFDPKVLPHVFERFRRGDERGSVGLGMSIVRTIVEAHDGQCEALNRDEGGATVRLLIPRVD